MIALLLAALAAPSSPSLDGRWVSPCLAMGQGGRHGTIVALTVSGKAVEMTGQTYAHADCDAPTIETRLTGALGDVTAHEHAVTAVLTVDDVTMKPELADVVTIWNRGRAAKHCASSDWRLDERQSVAGGACVPGHRFPERGAAIPVHATVDGDRLTLPYPLPGGDGGPIVLTRAQ